jgi:AAA+ superfamily predicted ATPase
MIAMTAMSIFLDIAIYIIKLEIIDCECYLSVIYMLEVQMRIFEFSVVMERKMERKEDERQECTQIMPINPRGISQLQDLSYEGVFILTPNRYDDGEDINFESAFIGKLLGTFVQMNDDETLEFVLESFAVNEGVSFSELRCEEITAYRFLDIFDDRYKFVNYSNRNPMSESATYKDIKIFGYRYNNAIDEYTIHDKDVKKSDILKEYRHINSKSLDSELARITKYMQRTRPNSASFGHPAHYFFHCDSPTEFSVMSKLLLFALFESKRLSSSRYTVLNVDVLFNTETSRFKKYSAREILFKIYEYAKGGTVVLRNIRANEEAQLICEAVEKYSQGVLTIFDFPKHEQRLKNRIEAHLDDLLFIEIKEDSFNKEDACGYLTLLSEENHLETDDELFSIVDKKRMVYNQNELLRHFNAWKSVKLISANYPEYSEHFDAVLAERARNRNGILELNSLIGLVGIKKEVERIVKEIRFNRNFSKSADGGNQMSAMHMFFTGSPGTAKTAVARIIAKILKEEGLLPKGDFIETSGPEITGYIGSLHYLIDLFELAKGGVLFIDEAYALATSDLVTELIALLENHRDDIVVIFAGYKGNMTKLINSNDGFKSRVPFHIDFPDYTAGELLGIMKLMLAKDGVIVNSKTLTALSQNFVRVSKKKNYGNGRYVRNLLEKAHRNQRGRLMDAFSETDVGPTEKELRTLLSEDFFPTRKISTIKTCDGMNELQGLIGLESVKSTLKKTMNLIEYGQKYEAAQINSCKHMFFTGNPGTAKTTVARITAKILHECGILEQGSFTEVGRADLIGSFVGATAPKIKSVFESAKGGVLFIDEAYSLVDEQRSGYGKEAVDTIIAELENNRDDTIVIFAGYKSDMGKLLDVNSGFESRVPFHIDFPDYSVDELITILKLMAKERGIILTKTILAKSKDIFLKERESNNFGNGRFVRNFIESAQMNMANRIMEIEDGVVGSREAFTLLPEDLEYNEAEVCKDNSPTIGFRM